MSLVASVMDPCESLRDESDVAIEGPRQAGPTRTVQDSDWSGHVANDPKVRGLFFLVDLTRCTNCSLAV